MLWWARLSLLQDSLLRQGALHRPPLPLLLLLLLLLLPLPLLLPSLQRRLARLMLRSLPLLLVPPQHLGHSCHPRLAMPHVPRAQGPAVRWHVRVCPMLQTAAGLAGGSWRHVQHVVQHVVHLAALHSEQ